MSATTAPEIHFTPEALAHVRQQLHSTRSQFLRLGVKESGCNGYMYMLDFLDAPEQDDLCLEFDENVRVCVRDADLDLVSGTEVDMLRQGLNSALVFKNPKATSYCGCGESFAVGASGAPASASDTDLAVNVGGDTAGDGAH